MTLHADPTESSAREPRDDAGAAWVSPACVLVGRWGGPGDDRGDQDEQAGLVVLALSRPSLP
jgi:hypothetical protein